jgi:hypothetical protein
MGVNDKLLDLAHKQRALAAWFELSGKLTPMSAEGLANSINACREAADALTDASVLVTQIARFHDAECPYRHDILIGNCCETNDIALTSTRRKA